MKILRQTVDKRLESIERAIRRLTAEVKTIKETLLATTNPILQGLKTKLDNIQTLVGQNTDGVKQIGLDVKALLDKINAGGSVTAADLQPLLDQADAISGSLASSISEEGATDASVPK